MALDMAMEGALWDVINARCTAQGAVTVENDADDFVINSILSGCITRE